MREQRTNVQVKKIKTKQKEKLQDNIYPLPLPPTLVINQPPHTYPIPPSFVVTTQWA